MTARWSLFGLLAVCLSTLIAGWCYVLISGKEVGWAIVGDKGGSITLVKNVLELRFLPDRRLSETRAYYFARPFQPLNYAEYHKASVFHSWDEGEGKAEDYSLRPFSFGYCESMITNRDFYFFRVPTVVIMLGLLFGMWRVGKGIRINKFAEERGGAR